MKRGILSDEKNKKKKVETTHFQFPIFYKQWKTLLVELNFVVILFQFKKRK